MNKKNVSFILLAILNLKRYQTHVKKEKRAFISKKKNAAVPYVQNSIFRLDKMNMSCVPLRSDVRSVRPKQHFRLDNMNKETVQSDKNK